MPWPQTQDIQIPESSPNSASPLPGARTTGTQNQGPSMPFTTCDQFLAIVSESSRLLKRDQLPAAEHLLAGAVKMAPMLPNEYAQNYYPLALAYLIRLRQRQERPDEAD